MVTLFYKKFKVSTGLVLFPFLRPFGFIKVQIWPSRTFGGVGTAYWSLKRAHREDFLGNEISIHYDVPLVESVE